MYFKEESDLIVEDNEEAENCADDWENSLASGQGLHMIVLIMTQYEYCSQIIKTIIWRL